MQDNLIGKIQKLIHRTELLQVQTGTKIFWAIIFLSFTSGFTKPIRD